MVVDSVFGDVEIPNVPLHVGLFSRFAEYDDQIALVDAISNKSYTYKELTNTSKRIACGLHKIGLRKGDVMSIYSYNSVEWVLMFWGVICAGGVVTPINPLYTKYELAAHLEDSGAKYICTIDTLMENCREACTKNANIQLQQIISLDGKSQDCTVFDDLMNDDCSMWLTLEKTTYTPSEDTALIPYSSGTTGLPKGVILTHKNLMANCLQLAHPARVAVNPENYASENKQDISLIVLPLYHTYGLFVLMIMGLAGGSKLVILPKFEPKSFLKAIETHKFLDVETGKEVGPNLNGELLIKGPNIMKGYLNNKEATKETLDEEGFLHTGDIGYYDEDNYFYIVDRMKELIKVKGFQVAPAELEALLLTHPKVEDAGVIGVPDERAGELPRAFVVIKPGISVQECEIIDYVADRSAPFKHLKGGVQFIEQIPRLPSGKIVRKQLQELFIS